MLLQGQKGFLRQYLLRKGVILTLLHSERPTLHTILVFECHRVKLTLSALNLYKAIICEKKKKNAMVKSANPDEMTFNEPSHPDLLHLQSSF